MIEKKIVLLLHFYSGVDLEILLDETRVILAFSKERIYVVDLTICAPSRLNLSRMVSVFLIQGHTRFHTVFATRLLKIASKLMEVTGVDWLENFILVIWPLLASL